MVDVQQVLDSNSPGIPYGDDYACDATFFTTAD